MSETKRNIPTFESFSENPDKYINPESVINEGKWAKIKKGEPGYDEQQKKFKEDEEKEKKKKEDEKNKKVNEEEEVTQPEAQPEGAEQVQPDLGAQVEGEESAGPVDKLETHVPTFQEYTEDIAQPEEGTEDETLGAQVQPTAQEGEENAAEAAQVAQEEANTDETAEAAPGEETATQDENDTTMDLEEPE